MAVNGFARQTGLASQTSTDDKFPYLIEAAIALSFAPPRFIALSSQAQRS
jgi:hypothetical protein